MQHIASTEALTAATTRLLQQSATLDDNGLRALGSLGVSELAATHGRWALAEQARLGSDEFTAYRRVREGED